MRAYSASSGTVRSGGSLARQQGFTVQRRSSAESIAPETQILLGDSMGEMMDYYGLGHIAFVGGSLVDTGCQNVLEPAACSLPVLVGPSQFNFASICRQLETAEALMTVKDAADLTDQLRLLLADPERRKRMGMPEKIDSVEQDCPASGGSQDRSAVGAAG